jgi:hypothetical protein
MLCIYVGNIATLSISLSRSGMEVIDSRKSVSVMRDSWIYCLNYYFVGVMRSLRKPPQGQEGMLSTLPCSSRDKVWIYSLEIQFIEHSQSERSFKTILTYVAVVFYLPGKAILFKQNCSFRRDFMEAGKVIHSLLLSSWERLRL